MCGSHRSPLVKEMEPDLENNRAKPPAITMRTQRRPLSRQPRRPKHREQLAMLDAERENRPPAPARAQGADQFVSIRIVVPLGQLCILDRGPFSPREGSSPGPLPNLPSS